MIEKAIDSHGSRVAHTSWSGRRPRCWGSETIVEFANHISKPINKEAHLLRCQGEIFLPMAAPATNSS
jgi:hypothetical protein